MSGQQIGKRGRWQGVARADRFVDLTGVAMLDRRRILAAAFAAMACPVCGVLPDPLIAQGPSGAPTSHRVPAGTIAPRGIPTVQPSRQCHPHGTRSAREMALKQAIRLPRPMVSDDAAFQRPFIEGGSDMRAPSTAIAAIADIGCRR